MLLEFLIITVLGDRQDIPTPSDHSNYRLVSLVSLVYLVYLVNLVYLV